MADVLAFVLRWVAAPLWAIAAIMLVYAIRTYPAVMGRWNEGKRDKEAAKEGDWKRLRAEIDRLDARCEQIEHREQECQSRLTDALHRIGELEGYNLGRGEAKNEAQRMLSAEREIDATKRKNGGDK